MGVEVGVGDGVGVLDGICVGTTIGVYVAVTVGALVGSPVFVAVGEFFGGTMMMAERVVVGATSTAVVVVRSTVGLASTSGVNVCCGKTAASAFGRTLNK